ncbi:adenine phosphoribosyltransferase isoform X1 [Festucalex cinctus]
MEGRSDSKIELLRRSIRAVPDFPKKGILFRDICPILKDPTALTVVIDLFEEHVKNKNWEVDLIVGLDARGFLFGPLLAQRLGVGFVMVRKKGKLPGATVSVAYDLEYGKAEAEIQEDAVAPGQKVVILDDLLATGAQLFLHHNGPIQNPHHCRRCTYLPVDLPLHPALTREQDPKKLELIHLGQDLIPDPERAPHPFPTEDHGLRFGGADLHPNRFALGCETLQ